MKSKFFFRELTVFLVAVFLVTSCTDEIDRPVFPISAVISHSIKDKQVAFTALTHSAVSWTWDFGDGKTSNEQNPVHVYEKGGYYKTTLVATDASGGTANDEVDLALDLKPINYLTGNQNEPGYKGKTWRLTKNHSPQDKFANPDAELTYLAPDVVTQLPPGAFGTYLGVPEIYDDEFTFYFDGKYSHNVKADGGTFAGLLYASLLQQMGGTSITKLSGKAVFGDDIFAIATFSPSSNASFTFKEKDDYTIPTLPDFATGAVQGVPIITYPGVMTIDFPNSNEFIGIMDFQRKVIVQNITDTSMRLVMFITLDPRAVVSNNPLIVLSTTALVLTFEVVK